jgi:hypothetical protein
MGQLLVNGVENHRKLPSGQRSEVFIGGRRVLDSVKQISNTSAMCTPRDSPTDRPGTTGRDRKTLPHRWTKKAARLHPFVRGLRSLRRWTTVAQSAKRHPTAPLRWRQAFFRVLRSEPGQPSPLRLGLGIFGESGAGGTGKMICREFDWIGNTDRALRRFATVRRGADVAEAAGQIPLAWQRRCLGRSSTGLRRQSLHRIFRQKNPSKILSASY